MPTSISPGCSLHDKRSGSPTSGFYNCLCGAILCSHRAVPCTSNCRGEFVRNGCWTCRLGSAVLTYLPPYQCIACRVSHAGNSTSTQPHTSNSAFSLQSASLNVTNNIVHPVLNGSASQCLQRPFAVQWCFLQYSVQSVHTPCWAGCVQSLPGGASLSATLQCTSNPGRASLNCCTKPSKSSCCVPGFAPTSRVLRAAAKPRPPSVLLVAVSCCSRLLSWSKLRLHPLRFRPCSRAKPPLARQACRVVMGASAQGRTQTPHNEFAVDREETMGLKHSPTPTNL